MTPGATEALTLGVCAHVDAGKTTFCEALLYLAGCIGSPGRVDHQNTIMDHDALEKRRGITIFSGIASFDWEGCRYTLVDTPGHADFSAEMERTLGVLDAAILVVSAVEGVQSHTVTLFRLLRERGVPVYVFLNKADREGANIEAVVAEITRRLTPHCRYLPQGLEPAEADLAEWLCDYDDDLMTCYLEGKAVPPQVLDSLSRQIGSGTVCLLQSGSALRQEGVARLLGTIGMTARPRERALSFAARAFKTEFDQRGNRVTFVKVLGGTLQVRAEVAQGQKAHELRVYRGRDYVQVQQAGPGEIVGVTGLTLAAGQGLGACPDTAAPVLRPALRAAVFSDQSHDTVMQALRRLEAQDPMLGVSVVPGLNQIQVQVMGRVQLEVLAELLSARWGVEAAFGPCDVVYKETIARSVTGYGHYEPLRHYAEVHLLLEPGKAQDGELTFETRVHTDDLPRQYQNLIRHSVLDRDHKGVLTGSSLAGVKVTLLRAAVHEKHTEGGDLREATWRAIRQGLEKAETVLLEPVYAFVIDVALPDVGRVLADITRLHGSFEPPRTEGEHAVIRGRGPVETFLDYPAQLMSFTGGTGSVSLALAGWAPCHDPDRIVAKTGYQPQRDLDNPSSSVFCAKGAGFEVKGHEAESYMHLPLHHPEKRI